MIQRTLKTINGKLTVTIPDQLHEVTLGQLIAMQASANLTDLDAIHILSGIELQELKQVKDFNDFQVFTDAVLSLSYQIKYLYNSEDIPDQVSFNLNGENKTVKVIKNLAVEPAGAFMAAREVIAEEIAQHISNNGEENWRETFNPSLTTCATVLAHYFYCPATGQRYDERKAEEFTEEVKKLPVTAALPLCKYFFLSYPNLSRTKAGFWVRLLTHWSKRQASRRLKNLVISTP